MKVLLIAGGKSFEREVSLRSGVAIAEALDKSDHTMKFFDPAVDKNLVKQASSFDVVFIALHGKYGEDGTIQAQLEKAGISFTGTGSKASALCSDKWKYKKFIKDLGLPVPKGELVSLHRKNTRLFNKPFVLKPCDEGSSLDTLIARQPSKQTDAASQKLLENHNEMLLEELIEGTEITVGVFDGKPLPVIEIIPPANEEFDYDNKYNGKTLELCPPKNVSDKLQKQAQDLALEIHKKTGCRDMSRTDIMIDKNNNLYVLETNTIPGLTTQSLLPKMVQTAGLDMGYFVDRLLDLAVSR